MEFFCSNVDFLYISFHRCLTLSLFTCFPLEHIVLTKCSEDLYGMYFGIGLLARAHCTRIYLTLERANET